MATEESYPKLISLAVHELRTPAGVVGGYLRMLQRDTETPLSDRHRKMVDEAEKSCARLVTLIAELSDVAKLDAGLVTMNRRPMDLFTTVAEVAESVHEAEDRGVHLEVRGPHVGATIDGDVERLRAAIRAIFRAILREKPGPSIVIVDRRLDNKAGTISAVLVVSEEANVQAHDTPAEPFDDKRGGLGLALPIARRVIEEHGGRIWSAAVPKTTGDGGDHAQRGDAVIVFPLRG